MRIRAWILLFAVIGPASIANSADDFIHAVRSGNLQRVKTLVKADESLVSKPDDGTTPLHFAVRDARMEITKFLLEHGANVNAKSKRGETPIFRARSAQMARLLIEHGAKLDVKTENATAITNALRYNHRGVCKVLIESGQEIDFDSAIQLGETKLVAQMLAKKPWLAKPPRKPLYYPAGRDDLELTKLLLKHGADPDIDYGFMNVSGPYTPLTNAVTRDQYQTAELLLKQGASANVSGGRNHPNLFLYAIAYRDVKFTKLMLDHGAAVMYGASDQANATPLHVACSLGGNDQVARVGMVGQPASLGPDKSQALQKVTSLVNAGADVNAKTTYGQTPLLAAAMAGNQSVCDFLISNGAHLDAASACLLRKLPELKSILATNPELATKKQIALHASLLHWAVRSADAEIVEFVLSQKVNIDARAPRVSHCDSLGFRPDTYDGAPQFTALHLAAKLGSEPIAKLLIAAGANVDLKAGEKDSPISLLEIALHSKQWKVVRLLLDLGHKPPADFEDLYLLYNVKDPDLLWRLIGSIDGFDFESSDATHLLAKAIRQGETKTVQRLNSKGTKLDIFAACELGRIKEVSGLIDTDPTLVNATFDSHRKTTAISLAVEHGHIGVVRLMIGRGVSAEILRPLAHDAAVFGQLEILKLLTAGKSLRVLDDSGRTLLHAAASGIQPEIVKFLLQQGLEVDARNFNQETPLWQLGEYDYWKRKTSNDDLKRAVETAKLLIDAGSDVNAADHYGSTPLHQASKLGFAEVVRALLTHGAKVNHRDDTHQTPLAEVGMRSLFRFSSEHRDAVKKVLLEFGATR